MAKVPTVAIRYPIRVSEFRVKYPGQHQPQCPVIEITATNDIRATYDPNVGGTGYDPSRTFLRLPREISMPEIRAIMRAIVPAVERLIEAKANFNIADGEWTEASRRLDASFRQAVQDCGYEYCSHNYYVRMSNHDYF